MTITRPLHVPVVLVGQQDEPSLQAARFIHQELRRHLGVRTELGDLGDPRLVPRLARADATIIVTPGHGRGVPDPTGALDSRLQAQVEKPAGIVAVSAGAGRGEAGAIATSLAILRPLGVVTLFWDVDAGAVGNAVDRDSGLRDEAVVRGTHKFIGELIWMAKAFPHARERAEWLAGTA